VAVGWIAVAASETITGTKVLDNCIDGLLDPAKLFAPPKELAHVDAGRTGNLGQNRTGLKAGCDEPLFVLARPAPTALHGRDDFN
jgi:hypothetical protein